MIDALRVAWHALQGQGHYYGGELVDLAFLGVAALLVLATLRCLPLAYGLYSIAALLPALTDPILAQPPEPLHGLPRYVLVAFPLFMAAAAWVEKRRIAPWVITLFSVGLIGMTAALAAWLPYY